MSNLPTDIIPDIPKFEDGIEKDVGEVDGDHTDTGSAPVPGAEGETASGDKQDGLGIEAVASGIVATLEAAAADGEDEGTIERTATPGSRTSTPPLGTSASAPKKFARVDVTKKFLSKTGTPAPAAKVTGTSVTYAFCFEY